MKAAGFCFETRAGPEIKKPSDPVTRRMKASHSGPLKTDQQTGLILLFDGEAGRVEAASTSTAEPVS